nr:hypothetical protein [Tanacetum cinerariifolium]
SQSRQLSASESAFAEEPVQTTCADDQPIVQTSQHPEWFFQPKRPSSPDRDWNNSASFSRRCSIMDKRTSKAN